MDPFGYKNMTNKPNLSRKTMRLKDFDYSSAGFYFVTVVSHKHKNIFCEINDGQIDLSLVGVIIEETWEAIPMHYSYVKLDSFVVMPNHIHGIIIIKEVGATHASPVLSKNKTLGVLLGSFKSAVTKRVHDEGMFLHERVWQRNYYEHVIRDEPDYNRIFEYIAHNPANWSLDEENVGSH